MRKLNSKREIYNLFGKIFIKAYNETNNPCWYMFDDIYESLKYQR